MSMWKRFRYRLEYAFVLAAAAWLQRGSLERAQAAGRALGRGAYHLGVARTNTFGNLKLALGLEGSEARRIAKAAFANFGQTMAELAWMPALDPADLDTLFTFDGLEKLEAARAAGKGIVCLSGHYGNWEWMGAALVRRGLPVTFLIGTQSNPYVDTLFNDYRAKLGMRMVRIKNIRDAMRVIKMNGLAALVGDQDGDKWGVFVPFFGQPASTYGIGELLARRGGAVLVFGVPVRLGPRSNHLKVHVIPDPPAGLDEARVTAWTLSEYNRLLEAAIREHPEQWLWMHHRWLSKPIHRLAGEDRQRAERGELAFDMDAQTWRVVATGEALVPDGWK